MSVTCPYFSIVVHSNNFAIETSTIPAFNFVVLIALVAEIMTAGS